MPLLLSTICNEDLLVPIWIPSVGFHIFRFVCRHGGVCSSIYAIQCDIAARCGKDGFRIFLCFLGD